MKNKIEHTKIPIDFLSKSNYILSKPNDPSFVKHSKDVLWLKFRKDGTFKKEFKKIKKGRSLIMSPFNSFFTWQTTEVIKILEQTDYFVRFKTKNSEYKLTRLW